MTNQTRYDYITERELSYALDPIKDDLREMKQDVKTLLDAHGAPDPNAWLGQRGRGVVTAAVTGLMVAIISTGAATAVHFVLG